MKRGREPVALTYFFYRSARTGEKSIPAERIRDPHPPVFGTMWRATVHGFPQRLDFGFSLGRVHPIVEGRKKGDTARPPRRSSSAPAMNSCAFWLIQISGDDRYVDASLISSTAHRQHYV
jgi:hypothetical protein